MARPRSDPKLSGAAAGSRRSVILPSACLQLVAGVLLSFGRDLAGRARVERFVVASGLEPRRPLDVASLRLEPASDLAAAAAVEIALSNAGAPPAAPEPWLAAARDLMLGALRERPGWPLHAHVLAEVAYREARVASAATDPRRWMTAWRVAARGAPGADSIRSRRAEACLEAWPTLSPALRDETLGAVRAAFFDSEFVARHVGTAADLLGVEAAVGLLPDRAEPIRSAAAGLADRGIDRAARLLDRADLTERGERAAAVRQLEELERRGLRARLTEACRAFAATFPAERFDDAESRAQTARVLELWPAEPGVWGTDARGPFIRFFLDSTDDAVAPAAALRRAVASLSDCPAPVRAAALLLGGDRAAAEALRTSPAEAASDWAAYDLRAARDALRRGDASGARRAIDRLPSGQRESCEALLVRRDAARASKESAEAGALERRLAELRIEPSAAESWSRSGRLAMCLDPVASERWSLVVGLTAESPAVVAYGWDRGRAGTIVVRGGRVLVLPLEGRRGERSFWFAPLAGGPIVPREAAIRESQTPGSQGVADRVGTGSEPVLKIR